MHVAFIAPPLPGHLNPLRALAGELVRRGHRATLVCWADAGASWQGPGLTHRVAGDGDASAAALEAGIAALTRGGWLGLPSMLREVARGTDRLCAAAPEVVRAIGADLVVADQAEAAGGWVAARLGLPCVTAATALPLDPDPDVPPPWAGWLPDTTPSGRRRTLARWRVADLLMRPVDRVVARHARRAGMSPGPSRAWWSRRATLAQTVAGLDFPRAAAPSGLLYTGPWRERGDGTEAPGLPDESRPLAFCSLGTLQGGRAALFERIARACDALGLAAVIAHGGRLPQARARALPGSPIVRAFVPQRAVLARCAVAVVHGGLNTALDAAWAGVPVVALPLGFEQPGIAARLKHAGMAEVVGARDRAHHARIRDAIARVLDGPHRGRAAAVAREIAASGGVLAAADRIEAVGREG